MISHLLGKNAPALVLQAAVTGGFSFEGHASLVAGGPPQLKSFAVKNFNLGLGPASGVYVTGFGGAQQITGLPQWLTSLLMIQYPAPPPPPPPPV